MTRDEAIQLANDMAFMACIWIDDEGNEVNDLVKLIQSSYAAGAAAEREACAKVCEGISLRSSDRHDAMADDRNDEPILYMSGKENGAQSCADAIRARGQQ